MCKGGNDQNKEYGKGKGGVYWGIVLPQNVWLSSLLERGCEGCWLQIEEVDIRHSTIWCIERKYNDSSEGVRLGLVQTCLVGWQYSIKELADHLRWIIKEDRQRHIVIPSEPPVNVPKRIDLPVLGTEIDDVTNLNKKYLANEEQFWLNADQIWQAREAKGKRSMHSLLQPFGRPNVNELIGQRIDVLYSCTLPGDGGSVLRWCQCKMIEVYDYEWKWG